MDIRKHVLTNQIFDW